MAYNDANIIQGSDLMLFIGGKSIAFATSHSLSLSAETVETTNKDTGGKWVTKAARKISWTMNTENLYCVTGEGNTYDELFDAMVNRTALDVVFTLEGNSTTSKLDEVPTDGWTPKATSGYVGKAYVTSLELNAPNGDNATFTASFEGCSALTKRA